MPRNNNQAYSTRAKPYATYTSRGTNVSKGGVLSKESTAYIKKMVGLGRETKRKKKREQKKTEDGTVKRLVLARNGLIDKAMVGDMMIMIKKSSNEKNLEAIKEERLVIVLYSSSYSDVDSSSDSDSDFSSEASSPSSDDKKKKFQKKKRKSSADKPSAPAKSKSRTENNVRKLASGLEEA